MAMPTYLLLVGLSMQEILRNRIRAMDGVTIVTKIDNDKLQVVTHIDPKKFLSFDGVKKIKQIA